MRIYCPECDAQSEVPSDLLVAGIRKLRCRCCGIRYRVLPSGDNMPLPATTSSNPAQPISDQHAALGGAGFGQGSDDRPRAAAGHGADLPNLSVCQSPGSAWAGGVATVEQLDFPRLVLGSVFRHKYRIDAEIGQGGSAVVYRAHDLDAEMDVALKVVGVASSNSKLRTMGRAVRSPAG